MAPRAVRETTIANTVKEERAYAVNSPAGRLSFVNQCQGWEVYNQKTLQPTSMGFGPTLAAGLTECCIAFGRGKVLYIPRGDVTKSKSYNQLLDSEDGDFPEDVKMIPFLVYTNFKWDQSSTDEWYNLPHYARLNVLNARGNALSSDAPVMPLNVSFEMDTYPTIMFNESLATIVLYHNADGDTYLGRAADMAQHMDHILPVAHGNSRKRAFWKGPKPQLAPWQQNSGADVVQELARLYRAKHADSIWVFGDLMKRIIMAHDAWVANQGYTMEIDPFIGPEIVRMYREKIRDLEPPLVGEGRLAQLQADIARWQPRARASLQSFIDVSQTGVFEAAMFMLDDQGWNTLSADQKRSAVEYARLKHEAGAQDAGGQAHDGEDDDDADDD